jgi:hypothetical protein
LFDLLLLSHFFLLYSLLFFHFDGCCLDFALCTLIFNIFYVVCVCVFILSDVR